MLDTASIEAITQEAKNCFLYEDAPEYLQLFNQRLSDLQNAVLTNNLTNFAPICKDLIRAAHSIKGGAGISELFVLQKLAHKLEDLLELMAAELISDLPTAMELITLALEIITNLIELAKNGQSDDKLGDYPAQITVALEQLISNINSKNIINNNNSNHGNQKDSFIKKCLTNDLENILKRLENNLTKDELNLFIAECVLLGETLKLNWLEEIAKNYENKIAHKITNSNISLEEIAINLISEIRKLRDDFFSGKLINLNGKLKEENKPQEITPKTAIKESQQSEDYVHFQIEINSKNKLDLAISMNYIEEIVRIKLTYICQIPGVVSSILGVINHRGRLLWVLSIKEFLELEKNDFLTTNIKKHLIIIKYQGKQFGCLVDNLKDIFSINKQKLSSIYQTNNNYILGEYNNNLLIDIPAIFNQLKRLN